MDVELNISRRRLVALTAGLAATRLPDLAISRAAHAADAYPSRPVKWVVPYTAGGATDVISRLVCQYLSESLGQPFVVVNEPGAGANVGTEFVIKAPPDGYTLLLISTANLINVSFDKSVPFDFRSQIAPVAGVAQIPMVMVINKDIPANSVAEFISYAKAHPGKLSFASSGVGTSLHLSGELFKSMTGLDMVHVPYKGSAPALTDLMSGQIQLMFDNVTSSAPFIRDGRVRALGVTTQQRSSLLPDVPPIADTLPGFQTSSFYGLGAPAGTASAVIERLNGAVNGALATTTVAQKFDELGAIAIRGNAAAFTALVRTEIDRWSEIVKKSGASKD